MELQLPLKLQAAPGVWLARADREDLAGFGQAMSEAGARSVLLVRELARDGGSEFQQACAGDVQILNLGCTREVLVISVDHPAAGGAPSPAASGTGSFTGGGADVPAESGSGEEMADAAPNEAESNSRTGDRGFLLLLAELEPPLQQIGLLILAKVRTAYPSGALRYHPGSKRYVESPDNFWTIQYQPNVKDFRITLRGKPDTFPPGPLEVKPDRRSYSTFKVSRLEEVDEAVRLILSARRKG